MHVCEGPTLLATQRTFLSTMLTAIWVVPQAVDTTVLCLVCVRTATFPHHPSKGATDVCHRVLWDWHSLHTLRIDCKQQQVFTQVANEP